MAALWRGIVTGRPGPALTAFFPRPAYLRMKRGRIPDPASDYRSRLIADYGLDIAAAHRLLGASAAADTFVRVAVPPQSAWIPPGVCENGIGYWHVPGSRLIYRDPAGTASIGVSSLISWRGQWYVVHLAVNGDAGTVDAPARGLGSFGVPGGC